MSLINSAMRRVLAGDESLRALDPNGLRPRSSARVPRAVRARSAANSLPASRYYSEAFAAALAAEADALAAKCELLKHDIDTVIAEEGPTPYFRKPIPDDAILPKVMRGFA